MAGFKRNKWLPVIVSIVFAMLVLAGCGNNDTGGGLGEINVGESSEEASGTSTGGPSGEMLRSPDEVVESNMNEGWPAGAVLPSWFPAYPSGDIYFKVSEDGHIFIYVLETDKNTFNAYMNTLGSVGFSFKPPNEYEISSAVLDGWYIGISFIAEHDMARMMIDEWDFDYGSADWPEDFPEYPDGDDIFVSNPDTGSTWITIHNTSKSAMENFFVTLEQAGWEFIATSGDGRFSTFEKGNVTAGLLLGDDGSTLTISLIPI